MSFQSPSETEIIIIDDFFADPKRIRSAALALKYYRAPGNVAAAQSRTALFSRGVVDRFSKLVGSSITYDHKEANFGHFRLEVKSDRPRLLVHADHEDWAGLVHLSRPENIEGGTAFLTHKETGLTGPPTNAEAQMLGYEDAAAFDREVLLRDTLNPDAWQLSSLVPAVFNRLLLVRGSIYYHAPWGQFGDCFESGRLTQHFFFNIAK